MSYGRFELPRKKVTSDTLEERLTSNAYNNIIPARYLHQDEDGNVTEEPEDLFPRVAKNLALAEALYAEGTTPTVTPDQVKEVLHNRELIVSFLFSEKFNGRYFSDLSASERDELRNLDVPQDKEIELTEKNIKYFSYDSVVPEIEDEEVERQVRTVRSEFEEIQNRLKVIANSPTMMNAGLELQQLSACFVNSPEDDLEDIHQTAKEAALVFQSGGGQGYAAWKMRPYGDPVAATGGVASGPITFLETFDQMCETIAQGGKRRGAQMAVMRVTHPDVIEFIHSKNKDVSLAHTLRLNDPDDFTHNSFGDALEEARELISEDGKVPEHLRNAVEGHLSNFNISVGITDGFMEALKNGEEFTFTNPRTEEPHVATRETEEMYERYGLGEHVQVGEELSLPAQVIWDRIIEGAHENGEPGVIYLERVNRKHSFDVSEHPEHRILATNPCGEQPLEEYEACNLAHINLSTLAAEDAPDWRVWSQENEFGSLEEGVSEFLDSAIDWDELDYRVRYGTRLLDNVVTMSDFPVPEISRKVRDMRKVGLGVMGLAQLYVQLGVKYGSDEADEIARELMTHINHKSKTVSHNLSKERGVFNEWSDSKFADPASYPEWFRNHTGQDPEEWEDGFRLRNHNTTTVAPTGTTSMLGNTTGGIEPIFNVAYYKNVSEDVQGDEMLVEFDDYFLRVLEANDIDVEEVKLEAQEQMAENEFDGVDSLNTVPDEIGELFVTTSDVSAIQHSSLQCAVQDGVDSSISKTINAPNDASLEDTSEAFLHVYENGGKGVTYFRDGTRSKQVLTTRSQNMEFSDEGEAVGQILELIEESFDGLEEFLEHEEVSQKLPDIVIPSIEEAGRRKEPRPKQLPAVSQRINTGYGKMYINISLKDGRPFDLFASIGNSGGYTNAFTESLAKTISTALRAGVSPVELADDLRGTRSPKIAWDNGERVESIPDAFALALKRVVEDEVGESYEEDDQVKESIEKGENPECPECKSMEVVYSEGCKTCGACGWSEC